MSDIKIFVSHSPNRNSARIPGALFYNVIAGSAFQTEQVADGFYLDNTGDNISAKNKSYCELTTQYWAWKNQEADYYGFCHYRRLFDFNEKQHEETAWGTVEYDYLDQKTMEDLRLSEDQIRACVENYDFLIAHGVAAECMQADSVWDQYEKAPELHIEDAVLLKEIIEEKYPFLKEAASRLWEGKKLYPCNMFLMKKELFQEYSAVLFGILEEFEKRADMRNYSREGYRTIGHLGERIAGIYYLYLQEKGTCRLGELQIALIHNTDEEKADVPTDPRTVPIVLAANQKFVPVLAVCLSSMVRCFDRNRQYRIYILHTDISRESQNRVIGEITRKISGKITREITGEINDRSNLRLQFIHVGRMLAGYRLQAKQHISKETYYRFLILDLLKGCGKAVYLDCDTIVCRDLAELYDMDLGEDMIGAVVDPDFAGQCNQKHAEMKEYCQKVLGMSDPFRYFQAGVLLFNLTELRKATSVSRLLEMAETGDYRFSDQDILNILCRDRVRYLDMRWNLMSDCDHFRWGQVIRHAPYYILDQYEEARKDPYIIHYAGFLKPWMKPDEDYAEDFWRTARETDFYEILLWEMLGFRTHEAKAEPQGLSPDPFWLRGLRKVMRRVFPKDGKARKWAIGVYFKLKNL